MPNGQASSATNSAGRLATSEISRSTRGCCWKYCVMRGSTGDSMALAITASQPQLTSSHPCKAVAARCGARRAEPSIMISRLRRTARRSAALQTGGQPHAGKAMRIARRLTDHRRAAPRTGPEILDVHVVHLVGDVIQERRHREPAVTGLESGAQIEDAERTLHRPWILIHQHLRRGAVGVIGTEHQLLRMTGQRHALLEARDRLELG